MGVKIQTISNFRMSEQAHVSHYDRVSKRYHQMGVWGEAMVPWMNNLLRSTLELTPEDLMADIGGGSGATLQDLAMSVGNKEDWICIDPSTEMVALAEER